MGSNPFPFKRYVLYDMSIDKIKYIPEWITEEERTTLQNFLSMFRNFTMEEKNLMLQLDNCHILLFLTFYELESKYAVSILCHDNNNNNNLTILIELKSFNWLPFISDFQRKIKMRGSYFMSDETKMSEFRKQCRKQSLVIHETS